MYLQTEFSKISVSTEAGAESGFWKDRLPIKMTVSVSQELFWAFVLKNASRYRMHQACGQQTRWQWQCYISLIDSANEFNMFSTLSRHTTAMQLGKKSTTFAFSVGFKIAIAAARVVPQETSGQFNYHSLTPRQKACFLSCAKTLFPLSSKMKVLKVKD